MGLDTFDAATSVRHHRLGGQQPSVSHILMHQQKRQNSIQTASLSADQTTRFLGPCAHRLFLPTVAVCDKLLLFVLVALVIGVTLASSHTSRNHQVINTHETGQDEAQPSQAHDVAEVLQIRLSTMRLSDSAYLTLHLHAAPQVLVRPDSGYPST
ncbi:hypothetical protein P153DRAFT_382882 [Dothidotthia symphoricarpi CBS 119687]|uniref:Uncharacterized protein n=1 Tax=Dothidotthia symphoricarpi CBS 119687 TaxID=1392245 RepID=A0A6A6AJ71_9PLEO|nr:uncharacterized protein P153DRAFT_382882 [Dothidotthia symphoricarpi CBS 119687]KAF2131989.1 hypothetical protein P153DRAFT_382882 [Dothidotthia symphoricarpi CBS 119687]